MGLLRNHLALASLNLHQSLVRERRARERTTVAFDPEFSASSFYKLVQSFKGLKIWPFRNMEIHNHEKGSK
jgi:hypothetical protein